jgi:hypothetical protein
MLTPQNFLEHGNFAIEKEQLVKEICATVEISCYTKESIKEHCLVLKCLAAIVPNDSRIFTNESCNVIP